MDVIFWNEPSLTDSTANKLFPRYIGPYKISHWVRKHGYEAQVIDFISMLSEDQLYQATKKFITNKTLVLGISTTFLSLRPYVWSDGNQRLAPEHVIAVAKKIKEEYPNLKVVLGGYAAEVLSGWGVADATVMAYKDASEDIFLEYLDYLKNNTQPPISSLVFSKSLRLVTTDISRRPRIHYHKARNPKYNIEQDDFKFVEQDCILPHEVLPLDVSRGCIFACRFCQFPHLGKKKLDYVRGMDYIQQEIASNFEKFGTTNYHMLDDTFNDTEWKLSEFLKINEQLPFDINYSAYIRADLVDRFPNTADLLKESGLAGAMHGIESLHPYASNLVGKAWSGKRAREFIPHLFHNIWKGEVGQQLSFIVGLPKETPEDIQSTVDWVIDNKLFTAFFHGLYLYTKEEKSGAADINLYSEFDRNSEKYGFKFDADGKWFNETWTSDRAYYYSRKYRSQLLNHNHVDIWQITTLLGMGYDKNLLLNTASNKLPWNDIKAKLQIFLQLYYNKLMAL